MSFWYIFDKIDYDNIKKVVVIDREQTFKDKLNIGFFRTDRMRPIAMTGQSVPHKYYITFSVTYKDGTKKLHKREGGTYDANRLLQLYYDSEDEEQNLADINVKTNLNNQTKHNNLSSSNDKEYRNITDPRIDYAVKRNRDDNDLECSTTISSNIAIDTDQMFNFYGKGKRVEEASLEESTDDKDLVLNNEKNEEDSGLITLQKNQLPNGTYIVGGVIPPGTYDFTWVHGSGYIAFGRVDKKKEDDKTYKMFAIGNKYDYQIKRVINIICRENNYISVDPGLIVELSKSENIVIDL